MDSISRTPNISSTKTSNNHAENKNTVEQGIEDRPEKEKATGSKKDSAQDTPNTAKNRPNDQ